MLSGYLDLAEVGVFIGEDWQKVFIKPLSAIANVGFSSQDKNLTFLLGRFLLMHHSFDSQISLKGTSVYSVIT